MLAVIFGGLCLIALLSPGIYEGADSYKHFAISKFSYRYPVLFFDLWGKPVFTLFSSPFSQPGFFGIQLFNILVSILAVWFVWSICRIRNMKFAWMAVVLCFSSPVFFILTFSGLTEPLFAMASALTAFLILKRKYIIAAIVVSMLPFIRNEGFVMIPFFVLALMLQRQWKSLPFLFTGLLVITLAGYPLFKDFLWIFKSNPYVGASDLYGHGRLLHFVLNYDVIFGPVFTFFIVLGIAFYITALFKSSSGERKQLFTEILIIVLPAMAYFAAHSLAWYLGKGGSLGLTRVIAGIVPLAAVAGVRGLNLIDPLFGKKRMLKTVVVFLITGIALITPFLRFKIPYPAGPEEVVFDKAALWIGQNPTTGKTYCSNPYLFYRLGTDIFDQKKAGEYLPDPNAVENYVSPGDLVVWDNHLSAGEGRLPVAKMMENKWYELCAFFVSNNMGYQINGEPFMVYIFRRTRDTLQNSNYEKLEQLKYSSTEKKEIFRIDLPVSSRKDVRDTLFLLGPDAEFSPGMEIKYQELDLTEAPEFEVNAVIVPVAGQEYAGIELVCSVSHNNEVFAYLSKPILFKNLRPGELNTVTLTFFPEKNTHRDAVFKAYLWNPTKSSVYIDELSVFQIIRKQ